MPHVIHVSWKRPQSTGPVIIDHSHEEQQQLPTLANLAKTAQKIRSKHK
jgi:hypothetical protein